MSEARVTMAHGSGGRMSKRLVDEVMVPMYRNDILEEMHDGAQFNINGARLAFATDCHVVKPLFFPGGDIGRLAVCGTVNDVAMCGAKPLYLSAGFIIEEGFSMEKLHKIAKSMGEAAREAEVRIVTGDTKVVEKGAVDGVYINTTGVGAVMDGITISPGRVKPGQVVILSGSLGDHSVAVMASRHGITLPDNVVSDCAPLNKMLQTVLSQVPEIAVMRDPTRGGLGTLLNEIAEQADVSIVIDEASLLVKPEVQAVCDLLGFDPLYLANEGKVALFVDAKLADKVLAVMQQFSYGKNAKVIGKVSEGSAKVVMSTLVGGMRLIDMLTGEQLPRIC